MKRYILAFFAYTFYFLGLSAQSNSNVYISFLPSYGNINLNLSEGAYKINDSLKIDVLKFYISGIRFLKNKKPVLIEENSYHLIDASADRSFNLTIPNPNNIIFDQIQFNLGIDSSTNVSGVSGGDLDPTKGMYWTWQSGYINFKLEGLSKPEGITESEFQFHLGGYQFPNNALQTITLDVFNLNVLVIRFDVKSLLDSIDLNRQTNIMSPGAEAVKLSKRIRNSFKLLEE